MTEPPDDPNDLEALRADELTRSLAIFIAEHGGSPTMTGELASAMAEIARLYHNARLRARAAERRGRAAQAELEARRAVAHEAQGLLRALADYVSALNTQDPGRIVWCAEGAAAAEAALAEAVARLPEPQKADPAHLPEVTFLAALDPFSAPHDDNDDEDPRP